MVPCESGDLLGRCSSAMQKVSFMRYNPFTAEGAATGRPATDPIPSKNRRRSGPSATPKGKGNSKGNPLVPIVRLMDDEMLERCHPPLPGVPPVEWRRRLLSWLEMTPDAPELLLGAWSSFVRCQGESASPGAIEADEEPVDLANER